MSARPLCVLFPLPDNDFDTTESAVAWDILRENNIRVVFATEHGGVPSCDEKLLTGVICGQLGAERDAIDCYKRMIEDEAFNHPITWDSVVPGDYDGLWLSGGHAPRMRQYLGSYVLQCKVAAFWKLKRPVGAICHGPIVLARSLGDDGRSVLWGYKTMSLPHWMEQSAYWLTCCCLGKYYRTYDAYVEDEVRSVLQNPTTDYIQGPRKYLGEPQRGTRMNDGPDTMIYVDRHYASGRWPGDTYLLARTFVDMLKNARQHSQ